MPSIPVNFLIPIDGNPVQTRRLAHARALPARARDDAAREPARRDPGRGGARGPPARARRARALARELALRRGLPHDARRRRRRDLPDDRDAGFEVDGNPLRARREAALAERLPARRGRRRDPAARGRRGERPEPAAARAGAPDGSSAAAAAASASTRSRARRSARSARAAPTAACACSSGAQAPRMRVDGREVLLFAGQQLPRPRARIPEVVEAAARAARELGCAAGGSRLISGNLRAPRGARGASSRSSSAPRPRSPSRRGYMANVGVIPALVGPGDAVVSDALVPRLDHRRLPALARRRARVPARRRSTPLEPRSRDAARAHRRVLLALDGVYSMDGDVAPLGRSWSRSRSATARSCCSTTPTAPARSARAGRGTRGAPAA